MFTLSLTRSKIVSSLWFSGFKRLMLLIDKRPGGTVDTHPPLRRDI